MSLFGCSVCGCVGCPGAVGGAPFCLSVGAVASAAGVGVGAAALVLSCLASGAGASPRCAGCARASSVASLLSPSPLWRGARCSVCGRGLRVCGGGRVVPVGALGCGVAGCACGASASGAPASGAAPPRR